jgi:ankyrin repeat protein
MLLQNGSTALHMAAMSGRLEVVERLLAARAAVDAQLKVSTPP